MVVNKQQIVEYYESCEIDYKLIWNLNKSLAMHFGYWDDKVKNFPEALERENEILAEIVKVKKSDTILDAGCGIGGSAVYLTKKFGCKVIGITLSQKQVDSAIKNAAENKVDKLTNFRVNDFAKTNFENNSFDVIWGIESVCHVNEKESFIKEASRLLKKGGRLIIADGFASKSSYDSSEKPLMTNWLKGWSVNSLSTVEDFKTSLKKLKFRKISYRNVTNNIIPSSRRLYLYSFPALIFGKITEILAIRNKTQTGNIIAAHYQYKAIKRNLWEYGIFYAEK